MSTRANLLPPPATTAGGDATPTTPPRPRLSPPAINDPIVNQMRPDPAYAVAQAIIAADGTGDFETFSEAFAAAETLRSTALAVAGLTTSTPRHRVDYYVKPGIYREQPTKEAPPNAAFYALDPTPGSTILDWGISTGLPGNATLYWEGIDINNPTPTYDPKYPIHHANIGTSIFTRCGLWNNGTSAGGGKTGIGMDGYNDGTLVLHDVTIRDGGTNLHGWPEGKPRPETVVLSKVRVIEASYDHTIGYDALNDVVADDIWLVDSHAPHLDVRGAATRVHVSGCTGTVRHRAQDGTNLDVTDTRSDWPIPTGGLSARDKQRWGMT